MVRRLVEDPPAGSVPLESLMLAPPIVSPPKLICIGRNYVEHAAEGGVDVPTHPWLFAKYSNALLGHGEPVPYPPITEQLDYEGELAVVIGRTTRGVSEARAMESVAGYTILNDISARDLQELDDQWIRGKSLDGFAPLGPYFVTADEVDVRAVGIRTTVNGELRQDGSCADMVFGVPELIAFIAEGITLQPGDVIATGTPAGVGIGFDPPKFLQPGDVVEVSIPGFGTLRSPIGDVARGAA
jgi:acylpyruvate hydrolase